MLWIDAYDIHGDGTLAWGDAMTENGDRKFVARLTNDSLEVLVTTESEYSSLGGKGFFGKSQPTSKNETAAERRMVAEPVIEKQPPRRRRGSYERPERYKADDGAYYYRHWSVENPRTDSVLFEADPDDPHSPRIYYFKKVKAKNEKKAISIALDRLDVAQAKMTPIREVEKHAMLANNPGFVTAGSARKKRSKRNIFIFLERSHETGLYSGNLYDIPVDDWHRWGGTVVALNTNGVTDVPASLNEQTLAKIAVAKPTEQVEVFASIYNVEVDIVTAKMMGMYMQTQMNTLQMMQNINADLNTETTCIMTDGCIYQNTGIPGSGEMTFP